MTSTSTELFPGQDYEVPFPEIDGHKVTDLVVRLTGKLELNRNDPDHARFVESLTLGRMLNLNVIASVDGKAQNLRGSTETDDEQTTYAVSLRLHSADLT